MNLVDRLADWGPVRQALVATLFTWGVTALGASLIFAVRGVSDRLMATMHGFAAGVMIAASYWSLLAPAIAMAEAEGRVAAWIPAAVGFLGGALFLAAADRALPHLHPGLPMKRAEGPQTGWQRSTLLVLAITLHNIPEGLAVGVAFGAAGAGLPEATLSAAIALAIGSACRTSPRAWRSPCRCAAKGSPRAAASGSASSRGSSSRSPVSWVPLPSCWSARCSPTRCRSRPGR